MACERWLSADLLVPGNILMDADKHMYLVPAQCPNFHLEGMVIELATGNSKHEVLK